MVKLYEGGVFLLGGEETLTEEENEKKYGKSKEKPGKEYGKKGTMSYSILKAHNTSENMENLKLKFDSMASHDITFVGIIQTAKASGMEKFPLPYVLTNCHNSLCAVGGTINEDDHMFGLSAVKKYGGIYVPPHIAVIHQYMRECMAGCGRMILGSDSHTRYGALGTMAIGEGGGELVKQLLCATYDVAYPDVIAVYLSGKPGPGVGPQDIALAIIREVFQCGYVKNKIMEFVGPGISALPMDYRNGIDVMTTETACLTSIWKTDEETREYLALHGRGEDYKELAPEAVAYYDGMIAVDLSTIKPMIALPFHPSNAFEIDELNADMGDILRSVEKSAAEFTGSSSVPFSLTDKLEGGKLKVDQAIIAGCAGGSYTNIMEAAHILEGRSCGTDRFNLSVYPSSQPVFLDLVKKGAVATLMEAGVTLRTAFCGPCFGAGDTPANGTLSIRHTTRNFPSREGSKPGEGQIASVALMDARSIAATAANGGLLTSAEKMTKRWEMPTYFFDSAVYNSRVYRGSGNAEEELIYGPNIKDWPKMSPLTNNILLKVCSKIMDAVTTTDELIPSGETASFRSNPLGLAEFTLSRRDIGYVERTKAVDEIEKIRENGRSPEVVSEEIQNAFDKIRQITDYEPISDLDTEIGSVIYAVKPGDGSAREQAASCQRVLGGLANIASEYATKRYRSNLMNWGMLPFLMKEVPEFEVGDYIFVPNIRNVLNGDLTEIPAYVLGEENKKIHLSIAHMTEEERQIVKDGCLINYNKFKHQAAIQ